MIYIILHGVRKLESKIKKEYPIYASTPFIEYIETPIIQICKFNIKKKKKILSLHDDLIDTFETMDAFNIVNNTIITKANNPDTRYPRYSFDIASLTRLEAMHDVWK